MALTEEQEKQIQARILALEEKLQKTPTDNTAKVDELQKMLHELREKLETLTKKPEPVSDENLADVMAGFF